MQFRVHFASWSMSMSSLLIFEWPEVFKVFHFSDKLLIHRKWLLDSFAPQTTMCFQAYKDCMQICLNYTTYKKTWTTGPTWNDLRAPSKLEVFAKRGTFNPDKIVFEYQPLRVEDWERVKVGGMWLWEEEGVKRGKEEKEWEGERGKGRGGGEVDQSVTIFVLQPNWRSEGNLQPR